MSDCVQQPSCSELPCIKPESCSDSPSSSSSPSISISISISISTLPNELLLLIASELDPCSLSRWMRTSKQFYAFFVDRLYSDDMDASLSDGSGGLAASLRHGCHAGHYGTLERCLATGADLNAPGVLETALRGESPLETVRWLLEHGASPATTTDTTLWPVLGMVLDACSQAPRWCPLPVLQCIFRHIRGGKSLSTLLQDTAAPPPSPLAMTLWARVMALAQVRGPRRKNSMSSETDDDGNFALRYDHCQHSEPCCLAVTKLLLHRGGADPNLHHGDTTLLFLAMCDPRRPVELVRCLADAGADLTGRCHLSGPSYASTSFSFPSSSSSPSSSSLSLPAMDSLATPPLQLALEDAVRLQSLRRFPRGRDWVCYPAVQCPRASDVVRFLLTKKVPVDERSQLLLDRLDLNRNPRHRNSNDDGDEPPRKVMRANGSGRKYLR